MVLRLSDFNIIGLSEEEEVEGETEKVLKDKMAKKFFKFGKSQNYRLRSKTNPKQNKLKSSPNTS